MGKLKNTIDKYPFGILAFGLCIYVTLFLVPIDWIMLEDSGVFIPLSFMAAGCFFVFGLSLFSKINIPKDRIAPFGIFIKILVIILVIIMTGIIMGSIIMIRHKEVTQCIDKKTKTFEEEEIVVISFGKMRIVN